ncbi:hypothetical protein 3 [Drosophila-associated adintovirus 2]|uniref:Uncharacterized protein n=1 Tax=Drosophila-associated adintovirus 2 TaxID=2744817 RepID=A0A7D4ZSK6_9VIRU|nr:hypothetical protein 3 [Drosophila-associated adintovirus 2]
MHNSTHKLIKVILMQPNEYHKLITNNRGEELINRKFLPIICNSKLSDFDKWIKIRQELNYFVYKKKKRGLYSDINKNQEKSIINMNVSTQTYDEKPTTSKQEKTYDNKPSTSKQVKHFDNDYIDTNINAKPEKILNSFKNTDNVLSTSQEVTPQIDLGQRPKRTFNAIDTPNDKGMNNQPSKRRHFPKRINFVKTKKSKNRIINAEVNLRDHNYIVGREKLRRSSRHVEKLSIPDIISTEELYPAKTSQNNREKTKKHSSRVKPYQVGKNRLNWITLR